jgi:hypothetical protein
MPDENNTETEAELRARLNTEAARIPWRELQRHFARGAILVIATDLDLIEVAVKMVMDDVGHIEAWREEDRIRTASDDDAAEWLRRDAALWAVVAAPWVLVQEQACRITEKPAN